jgi:hypothetical protein
MAYVIPGTLIYQQLATNAGVAAVTPDLDVCILGPCYNVVSYVAGSTESLQATAALDQPNGVTTALADNSQTKTVYLGSVKVGQTVNSSSVSVYFNNSLVESKVLYMTGTAGANSLSFASYTGSGNASAASNVITGASNPTQLNVGDIITIVGAGVGAANLTSTITSVSGGNITIADTVTTTVSSTTITRVSFNNLNLNSSTLRVESGDDVIITYGSTIFDSTVLATVGTGTVLTGLTLSDVLPVGITTPFTVSIRKAYNNLLLPLSYNSHTNYSLSNVTTTGAIVINPLPQVSYGTVVSGDIHVAYKALRQDLGNTLLDISDIDTLEGTLGTASSDNPLALGCEITLANTIGRVMAVTIPSEDLSGYLSAMELLENSKVYAIVPLTQSIDILAAVQQHVEQMSMPESHSWRIALVNTNIPSVKYIGSYNPDLVNANAGNNSVALISSNYVLTSSNSQFIADGVIPGDTVKITSHAPAAQTVTSLTVVNVLNNQQLVVNATLALTAVNFYVQRTLTKSQQAEIVAANSETFSSGRVIHVQPDLVGVVVNGVTQYLPGYYLCCALGGLVSGLPAQQSLTNVGVAGITDLLHSNRYFTRAQIKTIAGTGTCLLVQEAAGTIPYVQHALTTDMSVLQYREVQQVKNIDYLSYYFHDILKTFPGRYNITPDTLQVLRTTITAGGKYLQGQVLPKIGPPLLSFQIKTLKQDENNKDQVVVEMPVSMPTVMNYINLYLIY